MLRTFARISLVFIGLFLLVIAALALLSRTQFATSAAESRLREWIHPSIQINGAVRISVLPRLGLDFTEITIPAQGGNRPAVSVEQLQWHVSWGSLFDRTVTIDDLYVQGVKLYQGGSSWEVLSGDGQASMFDSRAWAQWVGSGKDMDGQWRVLIRQALFEDIEVLRADGDVRQTPLASLAQLEMSATFSSLAMTGSEARMGFRRLLVTDPDAFGHAPALLEQLGVATHGAWDVTAMDSVWRAEGQGQLRLASLKASGNWGELSAADGTLDLRTGEISIPMHVSLTNSPTFRTRSLEINVRQSQMRFELTGTLREPGVRWADQRR